MKPRTKTKQKKKKKQTVAKTVKTGVQELESVYRRIQEGRREPLCEYLSNVTTDWGSDVWEALRVLGRANDKKLIHMMDAVVDINCRAERELMETLEGLLYEALEAAKHREELQRLTAEEISREADRRFPKPSPPENLAPVASSWWKQAWKRITSKKESV